MDFTFDTNYRAEGSIGGFANDLHQRLCGRCFCLDCDEQFFSVQDQYRQCMQYERKLTDREAAPTAKSLRSSAAVDPALVQERLAKHGDLVMSRWRKRSKDERAELLLRTRFTSCIIALSTVWMNGRRSISTNFEILERSGDWPSISRPCAS